MHIHIHIYVVRIFLSANFVIREEIVRKGEEEGRGREDGRKEGGGDGREEKEGGKTGVPKYKTSTWL